MKQKFHYATITEAINELKSQGYTCDFILADNQLTADGKSYAATDFEIVDLYRYEGNSDPGDEATVYALVSKNGTKGTLVTGYGASFDEASDETLRQLHYKYEQENQGE
ncbi:MAG: phosphoribosylpyrophosphate synthetase [Mucilaginibacter sp.]